MKAVVVGGTGATGKELIGQLLENPKWERVISLARREVNLPDQYKSLSTAKLKQQIISLDNLAAEGQGSFEGADVVFCTLGTTRAQAGSADNFIKVDLGYVRETAKLAREAGVPHFSLLTAVGSKSSQWANKWPVFHPLLYMQTKGKAEDVVKQQGFKRVSIFQPKVLQRKGTKTWPEALLGPFVSSVDVADVAKCMILDAERPALGERIIGMDSILQSAANNRAP